MLKKDLEVEVDSLDTRNRALIQEIRTLEKECKKLKDDNNDMKMEIGDLRRGRDKAVTIIDGIAAIKYPNLDRSYEFPSDMSQIDDFPEEARFLSYLRKVLSNTNMPIRF
jgi:cell division protein FtsB